MQKDVTRLFFARSLVLFIPLLFVFIISYAQREANNWFFGRGQVTHIGFANNSPAVLNTPALSSAGGAASMSDRNGNLLFHSEGYLVYNRLNDVMQGISSLDPLSGNDLAGSGGSRGLITVPYPGNDSLYYLFYIENKYITNRVPRLRCAVINMNADNGLGRVVMKDSLMLNGDSVCIRLTAVRHCNKRDIWLIGHLSGSDKYFSFLITSSGINALPVFSTANFLTGFNSKLGYMKASPIGDKLASSYADDELTGDLGNIEFADFNNQTGQINNVKILQTRPPWALSNTAYGAGTWGIEFSPSGKFLYANGLYSVTNAVTAETHIFGHAFQFDLSSNSQVAIQASRYLVDSMESTAFGGMQLATNGKIYISEDNGTQLHSINNPEGFQLASNFARNVVGTNIYAGPDLPSFMQSYLRYPVITAGNCQSQTISFGIQNLVGVTNVNWDFDDPASGIYNNSTSINPIHNYSTSGTYNVKITLQNSNGCGADTLYKQIHAGPFSVFLGNDTTFCSGDTLRLSMNIPFANNIWSNNSLDTIIQITQPGTYWVKVNMGECFTSDTIEVFMRNLPQFTLGVDTVICNNQSVLLLAFPVNIGSSYLWNTNAQSASIMVNNAGNYWLEESDDIGCKWRDSLNVIYRTLPQYQLLNDTAVCEEDTLSIRLNINGATGYLWNTGESTSVIQGFQAGYYWCDITYGGCLYRDSLLLTVKALPLVDLGIDTSLCESESLMLNAINPASNYLWQNGSVGSTFTVITGGQYFVKVTMDGCIKKDTINIDYKLKPVFSLGADQLICIGKSILLNPLLDPFWQLLWQDGTMETTYTVTKPGTYLLTATNECGSKSNQIKINEGICDIYIPSVFTPNGDGKNDEFKVLGTEAIINFNFQIFNRLGQKLFETNDKNKGWTGKMNELEQSTGNYIWILRYNKWNSQIVEQIKGSVLLLH